MKNKLVYIFLLIITIMPLTAVKSDAVTPIQPQTGAITVTSDEQIDEETDIIKKVSFRDRFRKSPETEIQNFYKKYNRYSKKNNMEKLKSLYADDYINNDGFDKESTFKMMELAKDAYGEMDYTTEIQSIKVDGNYAVVKGHEIAKGETANILEKIKDTGEIISDIYYTNYLKREGGSWKLSASELTEEEVTLRYGEARNTDIFLSAPDCVAAGASYDVDLKLNSPDGVFIVGSIVNEQIIFPQIKTQDVFRSVKSEELSRVLKANENGRNEYATASIAITRAQIDPPSVILNMTGMAIVMKRVNVISAKPNVVPERKLSDAKSAAK